MASQKGHLSRSEPDCSFTLSLSALGPLKKPGWKSIESLNTGLVLADDERMHTFGSFQGAYGFQIAEMPDNVMIGQNSPSSEDIPRLAGDFHRLPDII